jgi:hypothetical protein
MKYISILALMLSAIALVVTLNRNFESPVIVQAPTKETNRPLQDELLKLQIKLAALEKALTQKAKEAEPLPQIQEQVEELTVFQTDLAEYALNIDPLGVIQVTEREIETAYITLMDESRSPWERAKQAALLKRYDQFDQDAIESMSNLFFTAEDPNEKAAALVALKDYVSPDVRIGVLDAFSADVGNGYKNGRLRYHGIEALEPLLPDPEVEAMLTHLAHNDPEPKIAGRAAQSVGLPTPEKGSGLPESDSADSFKGQADRPR